VCTLHARWLAECARAATPACRKTYQDNADSMKAQLTQQQKAVDQLIGNTRWVGDGRAGDGPDDGVGERLRQQATVGVLA